MTVIAVYAPTLSSDESAKDEFYEQLQQVVDSTPRRDILVVAGDFNAKTGAADNTTRKILGRYGVGQRCGNGDRLVNFAAFNQLVISSTRFQHRKKHLFTWYSNDGHTASQIDHVLISSRWASTVEDCRAYRGAEAGNASGSDHVLLRAKMKIHLAARRTKRPIKKLNTAALTDTNTRLKLVETIKADLQNHPPANQPETVEEQWARFKTVVKDAATKTLGYSTSRRKDWISAETIDLSKRAAYARINKTTDARHLRRLATRSAKRDRNAYWSRLATDMENANKVGDFATLYRLIHKASGQPMQHPTIRDLDGSLITEHDAKLRRWMEHFSTLLNHPHDLSLIPKEPTVNQYEVDCDSPSETELSVIIQLLKNRRSAGEDGLPAEIYKYGLPALIQPLKVLFDSIWETESIPEDWGLSILLPIPKKGDRCECSNYRGISLIDVAAKVFASVMVRRLRGMRESRLRPNQGGFRPGRGCVDQIFTLRRILEHRHQYQQPTTACFIDFRAAFDSVHRGSLWSILAADGVPDKLLALIEAYYSKTSARVRVYGEETEPIELFSGVRQGCPLSPMLFNFAIDWVMHRAMQNYSGVRLSQDSWIADLEYADDVVVLSASPSELQTVLDRITHYASMVGLAINADKTQYFTTCTDVHAAVTVNGENIALVSRFTYLGSMILPTGQAGDEITNRINKARTAFVRLGAVLWNRTEISVPAKLRVYQATVRQVLTYASETWPIRAEDIRRLEVFDHWCLRRIQRVRWTDRVTNHEVRMRCNIIQLTKFIQQRRLQWFGHVLRKPPCELSRMSLSPSPCEGWRRRPGGQLKTWLSTIKADVELFGLQAVYGVRQWKSNWLTYCSDLATDRRCWKAFIRDVMEADSSCTRS